MVIMHFFICIILLVVNVKADNATFIYTHKMAQECKTHLCQDGYNYKQFYTVDGEYLKQIRKDSEVAFEMHIGIQAPRDGHILLSSVMKPGPNDPVYEFVVGGGGNQFTELRRNVRRNAKASIRTPNILSTFEMRGFFIRITQDGLIEFFKEGETLPFLIYMDIAPIEINYFSFAVWTGVEAKFLYDCPNNAEKQTEGTPDSKEIDSAIPPAMRLKRTMLMYRYPWVSPRPVMNVTLGVKVTSTQYNVFESKLTTTISVVMNWTDESLAWSPDKFNNIKVFKTYQGQIWRPKFYVFNSDNIKLLDSGTSEFVSVDYSGHATFHFQTKINTWCIDSFEGLSKWPHDEYECSILIQPWEAHEKISLEIMSPDDNKMKIFSGLDEAIENEWETSVSQRIIDPLVWNQIFFEDDNITHHSDRLVIEVDLKRNAIPYNIVFYTPLLVLLIFVLMAFWTEPLTMSRVWFFTGCSIVISMGLCNMDFLIPTHNIPSILVLYVTVLGGVLLALLIQVLLMTSLSQTICDSKAMQKLFTSFIFRKLFCLPDFKAVFNGAYSLQENDDPPLTSHSADIEEMSRDNQVSFCDKKELAEVIDRVLFFVYSITFAVMLADHF